MFYANQKGEALFNPNEKKDGYEPITQACFDAFFKMQSLGKVPLRINRLAAYDEAQGVLATELIQDASDGEVLLWSSDYPYNDGYLPERPNEAYQWNGEAWVADDALLAQIEAEALEKFKAELCAAIDQQAITVGDNQIKRSVYLSSEYTRNAAEAQAWSDRGFSGEAPSVITVGALSHGISEQAEAELILSEAAAAEMLIDVLRSWRMNAKGINGIGGTQTAEQAQAVFDAAMLDLKIQLEHMMMVNKSAREIHHEATI
jgi:hypothetical protein